MARFLILALPGCPAEWRGKGCSLAYPLKFDAEGVAIGPRGQKTHDEATAKIARNFPDFFNVKEVDAVDDGGLLAAIPAGRFNAAQFLAALAAFGPPTAAQLVEAGVPADEAEAIAFAEAAAAHRGLFPYGLRARVAASIGEYNQLAQSLVDAGAAAPGPATDAQGRPVPTDLDEDDVDEATFAAAVRAEERLEAEERARAGASNIGPGAGEGEGGRATPTAPTPPPASPPAAAPAPAAPSAEPKPFDVVIEETLTEWTNTRGKGGEALRSICDALEIRGAGTSKSEMADAIRAHLKQHPGQKRAVHDLMKAQAQA